MKETHPQMQRNKPNGITNKRQYKFGAVGAEYSNRHAGAHARTESIGQIVHGTHKACK